MSNYLTVSAKGQVTLKKATLAHLGVRPGQRVAVELKPGGAVEIRPAPSGTMKAFFDCLPPYEGPKLSIEEINRIIERGWAGEL